MMKYNWLFIASFLGLPAPLCYANTDTGEIKDAEFVIEKQKKNKVNQEQRLFFKAPTRATKTLNKPLEALKELTLDDRSFDPTPEQYAPFCLPTKSRLRRFNHYAKVGIGTLLLPYLAVGLDNGTLWKGIWSGTLAFVPELANKKSRETALWLQSRYAIGAWLLQPDLQYQYGWHLYNGTKKDSCKLHQAKVGLLAQQAGESFTQDGKVRLHLLDDANKTLNEKLLTLEYRWLKRFNNWALKVASYNDMASYINDDHQQTRLIFSVTPSLYWPAWQSIQLKTGLRIAYHNDPIPDKIPNFDLYPMVKIGHHAASGFRPYIGIQGMGVGGSVTPLHLYHVVAKNPFVASNVKLSHRHQYWKLYGGSKGTLVTHLSYHLRLAYRQFKNQSRIMALTENQIGLAYHPAAYNVLKVTGVLEYDLPNIKLGTILKGCYYQYFNDPQTPKWWYHKPTYKFKPTLHYSPHQKLLLVSKLHLHGPTVVKDKQGVSRELGKKINLSLDMNYFISKRFTVFLLTSNLLNRKHIDYTRYPDKEINITGGLQYKW